MGADPWGKTPPDEDQGAGQSRVAASGKAAWGNRISGLLSHKLNLIGAIVAGSGYRAELAVSLE
jgi:hypothetical protein